ncbi:MAG: efflux RND transporter permease subunit [Cyanobacteria bacterium P01_F01_bin.53]
MWTIFYRNTRLLLLTICLICIWGMTAFNALPRMEDPEFSQYFGLVTTRFPGASAARVESLVTEKIEAELFQIENIEELISSSSSQVSTIFVQLKPGHNLSATWSDVRDRLNDIAPFLPAEASTPEYRSVEGAYTLIVGLKWVAATPPNYATLNRWAKALQDRLRSVDGTQAVDTYSTPAEEITVAVRSADLSTLGLTPTQLSQQITASDAKVSAGQLQATANRLLLDVDTQLDSVAHIRQIPIGKDETTGQVTVVGDVATVDKGTRDPLNVMALIQGKPAVAVAARMETGRRIDFWADRTQQTLSAFRQELPRSLELSVIFDQDPYVSDSFKNLMLSISLGGLCVAAVTVVMMGWRSALVVAASLPLTILTVFGGMNLLGIPLHRISMTGLVIALGLLVDNAIVVVDELKHRLTSGMNPKIAIAQTSRQLAVPLLASTLTTALTFVPIALQSGLSGDFIRTLAYSVILTLLSSFGISLTLIPALEALNYQQIKQQTKQQINKQADQPQQSPKSRIMKKAKSLWGRGFVSPQLTALYRTILMTVLQRPWRGIGVALIIPIIGFAVASTLPEQFIPPAERDQLYIEATLSPTATLNRTREVAEQAREILLRHHEIIDVHWFLGSEVPTFYINLPRNRDGENLASGLVQVREKSMATETIAALQRELSQTLPSAQILLRQLDQGQSVEAPIVLRLYGPNLSRLRALGHQLRAQLVATHHITQATTSLTNINPHIALALNETQTRLAGLDNREIARQLDTYLNGVLGGSILEDTEELPVRVRLREGDHNNLAAVTTLDLVPSDPGLNSRGSFGDASLPLSNVGELSLVPELATIGRYNGRRVNVLNAYVEAGTLPATALAEFEERLKSSDFQLPPGYSLEFGGEGAERDEIVNELFAAAAPVLVLVVGTLVLSFNSFRAAGIIFLVGLGAVGLALFSLWFFEYPVGFTAILGTIGLIGIAINDAIVVLAALQNDPKARLGQPLAMENVIVRSTRHVLTTTFTTMAGFIPILMAGGNLWPPLAICIAGGVGGATLLALFFVPCAYLLVAVPVSRTKVIKRN